jgi:hypothetical protein
MTRAKIADWYVAAGNPGWSVRKYAALGQLLQLADDLLDEEAEGLARFAQHMASCGLEPALRLRMAQRFVEGLALLAEAWRQRAH